MCLNHWSFLGVAFVGMFAGAVSAAPIVLDASFEDPTNGNGYGPVADWTQSPFPSGNPGFAGGYLTGAAGAGSAFWDNGTVPGEGVTGLVGAIQAYAPFGNSTMSLEQTVNGFVAGQTYTLSYDENSRAGTSTPLVEVLVGGQVVVALHADTAVDPGGTFSTPFRVETSIPFTVPVSGSALVEFRVTTSGGDSSALIDNVSIVPEPATFGLMAIGALGLLARRRGA